MATLRLLRGFENRAGLPVGYDNPAMSALINAILAGGHEVVLFTTSVGMDVPTVFAADGLTVCVARREPHAGRDLFKSERRDLVFLMRRYPVDIINAHWSYEFAWAALDSGLPVLVTVRDHALTVFRYRMDAYRLMRLIMNSYVLRRALYLSVNSQYLYERLKPEYQRKTKVIPNAFAPQILSRSNRYDERDNFLVSVANGFGRLKNIDTALRAFALLRKEWPGLQYRLIGDGMGRGGAAERFAHSSNVAQGVEFLGKIPHDQVLEQVRRAKFLLHPSLEESFGMSILEAMVLGTPVLGGNRSGNVPNLIAHGKSGILCDVSDARAIAQSASEILHDIEWAGSLAEAATAHAQSAYSLRTVVSKYLDYYLYILGK